MMDRMNRLEMQLPTYCSQNHASNIMPLPNGDMLCAWFSGTQEGLADISIYMARLPAGGSEWVDLKKMSDDPQRSEQNPVIFPTPEGQVWLMWTAQKSGNQDTAFIRRRISKDNGQTWGEIETLFDTPGTFIRQPVVVLQNGDWILPIFYCNTVPGEKWVGDADTSAVKISSDRGKTWSEYAVPESTGCVHMNVEQLSSGELVAVFRSRWADRIYMTTSADSGRTWLKPWPTQLPNNNSSVQFTRLNNGHLAMVFNNIGATDTTPRRASLYDEIDDEENTAGESVTEMKDQSQRTVSSERKAFWGTPRAPLSLAVSEDNGQTWPYIRDIETGDGFCLTNNSKEKLNREFSYPSIKQGPDGLLHITYTYFRQFIKYVRVPEDWVRGR